MTVAQSQLRAAPGVKNAVGHELHRRAKQGDEDECQAENYDASRD